ncbi:acyl-CoA N-acyltransferase [Phakopsora pachyrhizi]|uniref:Acyl-CoA N-acyltransferase n=1 Tax=Phakopsora pachyrhizi TaxID=170000 RepID=A0AAV0BF89_PHAPC|nr:acyl-CoA N-acyltransferase [Phakopsora pachyrhizi]CAH7685779.1 acyl-CoA N-acyltransferase [Phakopsora pachyrhizi]
MIDKQQSQTLIQQNLSTTFEFRTYQSDIDELRLIIDLIDKELSEPYIIYTYRYFLTYWPHLCILAFQKLTNDLVGVIICKQNENRVPSNRGYIAMLITKQSHRKLGIARSLVQIAIEKMVKDGAQEIVLETESDNREALNFYKNLGFIREKRLYAFYLNRKDAFRLVLQVPEKDDQFA